MTTLREEIKETIKNYTNSFESDYAVPEELIDKLLSLLSSRIMKVLPKEIKDKNTTVYTDFRKMDAYNQALKEVKEALKKELRK